MSEHRIDELRLRIVGGEGRADRVRGERFARRVLERTVEELDARIGSRTIHIRTLPVRWVLGALALETTSAIDRCAQDLAECLTALPLTPEPEAESEVVVFESEAHRRAAHLLIRASGVIPADWAFGDLERGDPVADLALPANGALLGEILLCLARQGKLERVMRSLDVRQVGELAAALGLPMGQGWLLPSVFGESAPNPLVGRIRERARNLSDSLTRPAVTLALWAFAREEAGADVSSAQLAELVAQGLYELGGERGSVRHSTRESPQGVDASLVELPPQGSDAPSTRYAGLFWLLSLALELDLAELLWRACLPEGAVLAESLRALLDSDQADDAAPRLIGGVEPPRLPDITADQQSEIAERLFCALLAALPRRGLARVPCLTVRLAHRRGERYLVATASGSPFPLFVAPAPDAPAVSRALERLVALWPRSAPRLRVPPGLTAVAPGRVDSESGRVWVPPWLPATVAPPPTIALITQIAGTLCHLLAARVGWEGTDVADLRAAHLALEASVEREGEDLVIVLEARRVDHAARAAGLDRDPGWVAWLERKVRVEFRGDGEFPREVAP